MFDISEVNTADVGNLFVDVEKSPSSEERRDDFSLFSEMLCKRLPEDTKCTHAVLAILNNMHKMEHWLGNNDFDWD